MLLFVSAQLTSMLVQPTTLKWALLRTSATYNQWHFHLLTSPHFWTLFSGTFLAWGDQNFTSQKLTWTGKKQAQCMYSIVEASVGGVWVDHGTVDPRTGEKYWSVRFWGEGGSRRSCAVFTSTVMLQGGNSWVWTFHNFALFNSPFSHNKNIVMYAS